MAEEECCSIVLAVALAVRAAAGMIYSVDSHSPGAEAVAAVAVDHTIAAADLHTPAADRHMVVAARHNAAAAVAGGSCCA